MLLEVLVESLLADDRALDEAAIVDEAFEVFVVLLVILVLVDVVVVVCVLLSRGADVLRMVLITVFGVLDISSVISYCDD